MRSRALLMALVLMAALGGCQSSEEEIQAFLDSARTLHEQGDDDKAALQLRNVLQLDAANVEANFMMAEYYEGERDWLRMLGHLEQVVKSDGGNVAARLKIAKLMLMKNELAGAAQEVAAVEAQEPDNAQAMMLRGVLLAREGDQKGGLEQAKRAYLADTSDIEIVGAYASMLMATGNAGEATEVILQALESRPDDNTLGVLLFQAYAAQDLRGEAAEVLIATARRDPHSLPNWRILAAYQARNGDFEAAEAVLREMNTANPDSVEAKLTLASFLGQRDEQAAVDVLKQFIADAPEASSELKFALGEAYLRGKSLDEASEQFQDIVASSSSPTQVLTARNQLARIALRQNRNDEAAAIVEEVLATDPRNRDALLARAAIALAANRADDAIIDLRTVWQDHPDSDQALVLMAQAYMQNSAEDLAERSLMEALKINPLNERAALGAARIRLAREDQAGALKVLETLSQGGVDSEDADALRLQILLSQRDWRGATSLAGDMADKRNNPGFDAYVLALTLQAQGHYREGIEQFTRALEKNPELQGAALGILRCHAALGESEAGLDWLRAYAAAGPENPERQLMLANELARIGQVKEAGAVYEAVIAAHPQNLDAYKLLGGLLVRQNDFAAAVQVFERGMEAIPQSLDLELLLADTVQRTGDPQRAERLYREVLEQMPTLDLAANNLAALLAGDGSDKQRLAEARTIALRFEKSDQPFFADTLGWIFYLGGEQESAERLLARAVAGAPEQALFHYHLGAVLEKLGRMAEAREHLQRARTLAAEHGQFDGYDEAMVLLARVSPDETP